MAASERCPDCGSEIPPDAPEGLCPRCLAGLVACTRTKIDDSEAADARRHIDVPLSDFGTNEKTDPDEERQ